MSEQYAFVLVGRDLWRLDEAIWVFSLTRPPQGGPTHDREHRQRDIFIERTRLYVAKAVPVEQRPDDLKILPRNRTIERGVGRGVKRLGKCMGAAYMLMCAIDSRSLTDESWKSDAPTYAAARPVEMMKRNDPSRVNNVLRRDWKPFRSVLHLALPIFQIRARLKMGWHDLLLDPGWVEPCLAAAEEWRADIPRRYTGIKPLELLPVRFRLATF
jgi:hypothetical protein